MSNSKIKEDNNETLESPYAEIQIKRTKMPVNEVADNFNKTKDITITEPEPLVTCEEEYSIFENQE